MSSGAKTGDTMIHSQITATEETDRLAIRELIDAYAHCADRRDADAQKSLFTENTHFVVYLEGQGSEPPQTVAPGALPGRARRSAPSDRSRTRRRCQSS
jgi:SnoaL-like protein